MILDNFFEQTKIFTTMKKSLVFISGLAILTSCKPNLHSNTPTANGLNFSNYVAVGNSLTAGYADGSLYRSGQQNSYPVMLSDQFSLFGATNFKVPFMPGEYGYPSPKLVLGYTTDCKGVTSLSPVPYSGVADTAGSNTNISAQGPFNNFGIPGIRAVDYLSAGYAVIASSLGAPYAARIFSDPYARPLDELKRNNPTFFTLWLGSNDVLGYATSGGEGSPIPNHPNNISSFANFRDGWDSTFAVLLRNGAKGVVMNIPDVTSIPFFTTVPANGLPLDTSSAAQLNAAYAGSGMTFHTGNNFFVIQDVSSPIGRRQIKSDELILLTLPQDSVKCAGWGTLKPIPQKYVLTTQEIQNIVTATNAFNQHIADMAVAKKIPLVDMNAYLKTISSGIMFNGVNFNTKFVTGGAFSLDGVHLTPRGYALVANQILLAINTYYKSTIPLIDVNKYVGIRFPM